MTNEEKDQILLSIARRKLRFDTLDTRNSDGLDFRDVAVWNVREALEAAFQAGYDAAGKTLATEDQARGEP